MFNYKEGDIIKLSPKDTLPLITNGLFWEDITNETPTLTTSDVVVYKCTKTPQLRLGL